MIDDDNDFDIDDDVAAREQRPLGLALPVVPEGVTLEELEHRHRNSKSPMPIMFTAHVGDDESQPEIFADVREAERFQRVMDWPMLPTVAEAEQWLAHRMSVAEHAEWQRKYGTK